MKGSLVDEQVSIHRATYVLFEGILDQGITASYRQGERVSTVYFEWRGIRWIAYVYDYINAEPQVYRLKVKPDFIYYKNSLEKHNEFIRAWESLEERPSFHDLEFTFMPDEALELMKWYAKVMFYTISEIKELGLPCIPDPIRISYGDVFSMMKLIMNPDIADSLPPVGYTMTEAAVEMIKEHQGI